MRVNTNVSAHNSWRQAYRLNQKLNSSLEKLSSGLRINSAADDAGGLAISEGMRAQIRGLAMAEKNAQDGLAFVNTAESALDEVHEMLQRCRELAVQAATGTVTDSQREAMQEELDEIYLEIDRLGLDTKFNGIQVFQAAGVAIQVGADDVAAEDRITVTTGLLDSQNIGVLPTDISGEVINTQPFAVLAIQGFEAAISDLSRKRAEIGAQANRMEHAIASIQTTREDIMAAESRIRDVDMAEEMTDLTKTQVLVQSAMAMLAQANARPQLVVSLLRA